MNWLDTRAESTRRPMADRGVSTPGSYANSTTLPAAGSADVSVIMLVVFGLTVLAIAMLLAAAVLARGGIVRVEVGAAALAYGLCVCALVLHAGRLARERAAREREIRKQNAIISLLLHDFDADGGDWLWETDNNGRLTYASERLSKNRGRALAELVGRPFAEAAGADPDEHGWQDLAATMRARAAIDGKVLGLRFADRQTWWRIIAKPLNGPVGEFAGYQGAAQDVTADRRHEGDLIAARDAAERASARKSHYMQTMSHELRTPLNAIIGFADLLSSSRGEQLTDDVRADYLRIIVDSSRRLQTLVKGVLDATRIDKGALRLVEQEVDAAELAEVAVKLCHELAERDDVTIVAHVLDGVEVRCDVARIKEVLVALIGAAVRASPPGASVEVRIERGAAGGLAVAVTDHGAGHGKEEIDRAFEPFLQVGAGDDVLDGSVSIARKIALLHDGDLVIESVASGGTTARLLLPPSRTIWRAAAGSPAIV